MPNNLIILEFCKIQMYGVPNLNSLLLVLSRNKDVKGLMQKRLFIYFSRLSP